MTKRRVGIVGATGYTGLVLTRLLLKHPLVEISKLYSRQYEGRTVGEISPQFFPLSTFRYERFDPDSEFDLDILFLALPHGTTHAIAERLYGKVRYVVDLSADFRLSDVDVFMDYYGVAHESPQLLPQTVYGIPELHRDAVSKTSWVANPGCYSTCVILGLSPLAKAGWIQGPVIVDAKSGVSGAGRGLKESSLYCEVNEDFSPYSTFRHRHVPEMESQLGMPLLFSPHLVPMTRGMLASMYVELAPGVTQDQISDCFHASYDREYFVHIVSPEQVHTKYVSGSNHVIIGWKWCESVNRLVVFSALDNLIKGASGQAIQNMNVMLGGEEQVGLEDLAWFM